MQESKEKKFKGSIRKRLVWIILFVTSLTTFIGYIAFLSWHMNQQYEKSLELSNTIAKVLSQDFAKVILLNEIAIAAEISTKLNSFQRVESMVLYKKDSTPIYQYSRDNRSFKVDRLPSKEKRVSTLSGNHLQLYTDASYLGTHIGYVQLHLKVETLVDVMKKNLPIILLLYLFMLFMSFSSALYFSKRFTKPILHLVKFLEKVELFNALKRRVETKEDNEFGKLYEEVNVMLGRMESSYKESQISAVAFETHSGMTITDATHKILKVNKAFTQITGYTQEDAIGKTPSILKSGVQGKEFYTKMAEILREHNYWSGEIYNRHKDGTIYSEYLTIQTVLNDNQDPLYYVASFIDITLQKETEAKLNYIKQYDALTGLSNKELLLQNLDTHLKEKKTEHFGALICFDIKEFKLINDAYGHNNADLLLQQLAKRLQDSCQKAKLIGRVGADEFILWFDNIGQEKESASITSKGIAQRIISTLSNAFKIEESEIHTIVYVGISLYNNATKDALLLFKQANSALHTAKRQDKEFAFFDEHAQEIAHTHIDMYTQLRHALEKNEFELFYQLQYHHDKANGAEALIRWNHPQRGIVSPLEFIPIAESSGLILPIGKWIIEEACRELAQWSKNPKTEAWTIAVNISAKQFAQDGFIEEIKSAVQKNKIKFSSLKIELTENIIVDDLEEVIQKMYELQKLGAKTSLDDFGTGYSSLEYLKKLPLNQVKIDQTFVKNMLNDDTDIAIIKSILLISNAKGLEVIAEGVETKEHYEVLKELGCNYFQGYYFAKPERVSNLAI